MKFVHHFETHPKCESLMADLNKNKKCNPFREKSKELIRSMGNTEYFEMCDITSEVQCQVCLFNWEMGIVYCACGKCLQLSERNRQLNKDRYDVLSIPNYVIKKNPSHGARHGPIDITSPQYVEAGPEEEVQHHIGNIPTRFYLSRLIDWNWMGWEHHDCIRRDRKIGPLGERSRNENSWSSY